MRRLIGKYKFLAGHLVYLCIKVRVVFLNAHPFYSKKRQLHFFVDKWQLSSVQKPFFLPEAGFTIEL